MGVYTPEGKDERLYALIEAPLMKHLLDEAKARKTNYAKVLRLIIRSRYEGERIAPKPAPEPKPIGELPLDARVYARIEPSLFKLFRAEARNFGQAYALFLRWVLSDRYWGTNFAPVNTSSNSSASAPKLARGPVPVSPEFLPPSDLPHEPEQTAAHLLEQAARTAISLLKSTKAKK